MATLRRAITLIEVAPGDTHRLGEFEVTAPYYALNTETCALLIETP